MNDPDMSYLKLLEQAYIADMDFNQYACSHTPTRLEYLAENLFDFTTYDPQISELFAAYAVDVCDAITNNTTFEFIKDPENYRWYLLMCNMPFFADRIEYGTSIRGAWWANRGLKFYNYFMDALPEKLTFGPDEWVKFINAVVEFGRGDNNASK